MKRAFEIKKTFFLVSQVLSFGHKKQTSKNVADTTFNVKKTELIFFPRKTANIDYGIKFKLDGKRLIPVNTVKYSGENNWLIFK